MVETERDVQPEVRSAARGRHWVAWVPDDTGRPQNAVVLVAETREEAERRARDWGRITRR
jgi:hypothetical protein